MGKYHWEGATWEKFFGKVPNNRMTTKYTGYGVWTDSNYTEYKLRI